MSSGTKGEISAPRWPGEWAALASPEVKERFAKLGAYPLPMTVDAVRNFLAQEFKVSEQIVKAAGIKPQD